MWNSIVQQFCDSGSKKSLIHRHPASILVVIFSECDDANFLKNTNERGKVKKQILILTLLKFLFFPLALWGEGKKSKSRNFGARHLHFLVDFDLILVDVPLMCMVANCTFSLMGRSLLTVAYSTVFNHVSVLQLLLRVKFHPFHFQMDCTISCFSLQDCLWFENYV